ncbi:MAG: T9SS type A sorting domain-containing protein [Flavobacteriales bacterium]|nr:T9SS type A sorting domain-containing protein [Flavobacteriales bacterium]MBP6696067.1 T9SS type A sorting domain-containing protein [Flavobacteriales bacterium]
MEHLLRVRHAAVCGALFSLAATAQEPCHFIRADSPNTDTVVFTFTGGGFASFGCAPIDPTYWMSGTGMEVTATFAQTIDFPAFRVWGMNDDDVASVAVNGIAYPLDAQSAQYDPKVVCGLSPGPDGVVFAAGNLVGANTNVDGNYSYQDVILNVLGVNSITVEGVAGAGWGFVGVSVYCATAVPDLSMAEQGLFPNPTSGIVQLTRPTNGTIAVSIHNTQGRLVKQLRAIGGSIDLSDLAPGIYTVRFENGAAWGAQRVVKY